MVCSTCCASATRCWRSRACARTATRAATTTRPTCCASGPTTRAGPTASSCASGATKTVVWPSANSRKKPGWTATAKSRVPLSDPSELGDDFGGLLDRVRQIAGAAADRRFLPTLDVGYRRITLFDARDQTRVTIDTGLSFGHATEPGVHQSTASVIVEVKSARPMSLTDRLLRDAGLRPQAQMSKYCIGLLACGLWTGASRFGANHRRLGLPAGGACRPVGVPLRRCRHEFSDRSGPGPARAGAAAGLRLLRRPRRRTSSARRSSRTTPGSIPTPSSSSSTTPTPGSRSSTRWTVRRPTCSSPTSAASSTRPPTAARRAAPTACWRRGGW